MKSMTGYASLTDQLGSTRLSVSIRAINGRHLDCKFSLPKSYMAIENTLRSEITKIFSRGSVSVYISKQDDGSSASNWSVQSQSGLAQAWKNEFSKLAEELELKDSLKMKDLLYLVPEALQINESDSIDDNEKQFVIDTVKAAAQLCNKERSTEGEALKAEFEGFLTQLKELLEQIQTLRQSFIDQYKERFEKRLNELRSDLEVDEQRLAQEVVFYLDKLDINEEITRLQAHMKNYKTIIQTTGEPIGRKLDFYGQELLREFNTIGSKSQQAELTDLVVQAKSIIEKLREQVQNVE